MKSVLNRVKELILNTSLILSLTNSFAVNPEKYFSKQLDSIIVSLDSSDNLLFYEGQQLEMSFYITNLSNKSKKFVFETPLVQQIKSSTGEIIFAPDYSLIFNFDANRDDFYNRDSYRLILESGKIDTVYERSFTHGFFGNTNLSDFVKVSDDEKIKFEKYFPRFLKSGTYKITYRFYTEPYSKFIEIEVPILIIPASGRIKQQQIDYMNALYEGLTMYQFNDKMDKSEYFKLENNPLYKALIKDTSTVYASDLIYPMILDITYRPSFVREIKSNPNYLFKYLDLLPRLTGFRSPIVLIEFYKFYANKIYDFIGQGLIYSEWEYLWEYVKRLNNFPAEAVNALIDKVVERQQLMLSDIKTLRRSIQK